jgi:hypothetical protein
MNLLLDYYNGTKAHDMPTVFAPSQKSSNDLDSKEQEVKEAIKIV